MIAPPSDLALENARRRHHEYYAPAMTANAWLRLFCALLCVALIAFAAVTAKLWREASHARLIVLTAAADGRLAAADYSDISAWRPGDPTLRYFAIRWATAYYSRIRYSLATDYTNSLKFLDQQLAAAAVEKEDRTRWIEAFQTSAEPEIRVTINQVRLGYEIRPPFHFSVDFRKDFYRGGERIKSETWTADVSYTLQPADRISNDLVPVNPLGIAIGEIREYEGFSH